MDVTIPPADAPALPPVLAGPMLRRATRDQLVFWLVLSTPAALHLSLYRDDRCLHRLDIPADSPQRVRIGEHAWVQLIDWHLESPLPTGTLLEYDLQLLAADAGPDRFVPSGRLADLLPELCYPGRSRPGFVIQEPITDLVHGSCRKPHFDGPDALACLDDLIGADPAAAARRPACLLLTGDQIYCDDVAGPMLMAIHQVIAHLGLYPERLTGATVADSAELFACPACYYDRTALLPRTKANERLQDRFFGGVRKPIFTTAEAHNHLITFAEVAAMYLLVWSPDPWSLVRLDPQRPPRPLTPEQTRRYQAEYRTLTGFRAALPAVRRALAHLPVYMIFDDHDITDDWNLSRGWEEVAYGHPFSRRIIGNALIAYWLFQGWGNDPARTAPLLAAARECFPPGTPARHQAPAEPTPVPALTAPQPFPQSPQDALIDRMLRFDHWHYSLPTHPKVIVLDTRTHRWWSESSPARPSGLMDWEELSELQQELLDQNAVILVSAAPILGVKLIENVQRLFTWFGQALLVDAENWMAHPGAANVMLNIFRHRRTPRHFVILSGDVHYSFVYDAELRHRHHSPHIWQITASGLKNQFPPELLRWFDRLNLWLYGSRSPLNWLTRRRRLRLRARRPDGDPRRRLHNGCALGQVRLSADGTPQEISLITPSGRIDFPKVSSWR